MKKILLIALAISSVCAGKQAFAKVDQSKMCIFTTDEEAKKCVAGELAWFSPSSWGNEQLPLSVMAAYCDFNHQVIYNNSGVICVFTDKRLFLLE